MSKSLFQALRESNESTSAPVSATPTKASKAMTELRESSRLMEAKSRLCEAFANYRDLVDEKVSIGESDWTQLADRLAGEILKLVQAGKEVKDAGACTYRYANNSDWEKNKELADEWATLNGEKMLVVEKGKSWGLLSDDLYSLSEFIESRIPVIFGENPDIAKVEKDFIAKEAQAPKANDKVEIKPTVQPTPEKPISESLKNLRITKSLKESERPVRKSLKEMKNAERPDANAKQVTTVTTGTELKPGVGGTKEGTETVVENEFLKEETEAILKEEFGDTNPTSLLVWFPGFLAQRLAMVKATCENTSDSWDEFGTFKEGKVYTSSYKITTGAGSVLVMDLAVMDCDDHWEIEYEVSYADGNWEQITDKTGEQVISGPKDQLRQLLGKIVSLIKEVCNKRKEKDDFRQNDDRVKEFEKEAKELEDLTKKAEKLEASARDAREKAVKARAKADEILKKAEEDPNVEADKITKAKGDADEAEADADTAEANAKEARDKANEMKDYLDKVYKSAPTSLPKLGEACNNRALREVRRLRCSGFVAQKLKKPEQTQKPINETK